MQRPEMVERQQADRGPTRGCKRGGCPWQRWVGLKLELEAEGKDRARGVCWNCRSSARRLGMRMTAREKSSGSRARSRRSRGWALALARASARGADAKGELGREARRPKGATAVEGGGHGAAVSA